jgi:cell division protein FtsZ
MGIGAARGDDRALVAAEGAIASPLLEASIEGAHGVLMNVSGGSDLGLFEIHEAAQLVADAAHPEANIIFGAVIDDALGDEVRVTVIAAGFDGGMPRARTYETRPARAREARSEEPTGYDSRESAPEDEAPVSPAAPTRAPERTPEPARATRPSPPRRTIVFDDADDLDVPDFLK